MKNVICGISAIALCLGPALPGAAGQQPHQTSPSPAETFWSTVNQQREGTVYLAACCKVCRKGKACGNSCISRSYTCHKGKGCACNG